MLGFSKKMFLTTNGKILACERIDQKFALGYITDEGVDLDFEILKKQAPLIETLIDCVREYSKILTRKKFEQQKYTFNDIARFCHDILVDENGNRTAVAERYSEEWCADAAPGWKTAVFHLYLCSCRKIF